MQSTILVRYVAFTIMRDLLFCLLFLGRLACRNTGFVVVSLLFDSAHCILYLCSLRETTARCIGPCRVPFWWCFWCVKFFFLLGTEIVTGSSFFLNNMRGKKGFLCGRGCGPLWAKTEKRRFFPLLEHIIVRPFIESWLHGLHKKKVSTV